MVDLTFILGENEVIPGKDLEQRPLNAVKRAMLLARRNHVRRRLDSLSCPVHGQGPRVTAAGPSPERLTLSVDGCCQQLADRARAILDEDAPANAVGPPEADLTDLPVPPEPSKEEPIIGSSVQAMMLTADAVEEGGEFPRLTEKDERGIEAVRRMLEVEFPEPEAGGSLDREAVDDAEARRTKPTPRARRAGLLLIAVLLLAAILGSLAATLATTPRVRRGDFPSRVDFAVETSGEAPPPSFEASRGPRRATARTHLSSGAWRHGHWETDGLQTTAVPRAVQAP